VKSRAAKRLHHRESGRLVAGRCQIAAGFWTRLVGWIGEDPDGDRALWLYACRWIHTIGVRSPIDVVLCGRDGVVLKILPGIPPNRTAGASYAIDICELSAGSAGRAGLAPGDHLDLLDL